eukprot:Nitzschia sp. Nitz4//scaffold47_size129522//47686//49032//NITZ4_003548-RA/size129522-processed-gene-0.137-mRNA-1//1//CDS//3329552791//2137//frame0
MGDNSSYERIGVSERPPWLEGRTQEAASTRAEESSIPGSIEYPPHAQDVGQFIDDYDESSPNFVDEKLSPWAVGEPGLSLDNASESDWNAGAESSAERRQTKAKWMILGFACCCCVFVAVVILGFVLGWFQNEKRIPTPSPTSAPSHSPTPFPSQTPTASPSKSPSQVPSLAPSLLPTVVFEEIWVDVQFDTFVSVETPNVCFSDETTLLVQGGMLPDDDDDFGNSTNATLLDDPIVATETTSIAFLTFHVENLPNATALAKGLHTIQASLMLEQVPSLVERDASNLTVYRWYSTESSPVSFLSNATWEDWEQLEWIMADVSGSAYYAGNIDTGELSEWLIQGTQVAIQPEEETVVIDVSDLILYNHTETVVGVANETDVLISTVSEEYLEEMELCFVLISQSSAEVGTEFYSQEAIDSKPSQLLVEFPSTESDETDPIPVAEGTIIV